MAAACSRPSGPQLTHGKGRRALIGKGERALEDPSTPGARAPIYLSPSESVNLLPFLLAVQHGTVPPSIVRSNRSLANVVPSGACPEPTDTTYTGPAPISPGTRARLCTTLQQLYPGGTEALGGLPMSLALRGPASRVIPLPLTQSGTGEACAWWTVDVPPGQYAVTAKFDPGSATPSRATEYLPSAASGQLIVTGSNSNPLNTTPPSTPLRGGSPLALGSVEPPPAPVGQPAPNAITQLQTEAQGQAQAQSQSQAQAASQVQPGFMVQRRSQEQVATQRAQLGQTQLEPMLASRRHPPATIAVQLIAASLLVGLGIIVRRPAVAVARTRRRRRG